MEVGIKNKYIISRLTHNEEHDVHTALTVPESEVLLEAARAHGIPEDKFRVMLADCIRIRLESFILDGLLSGDLIPRYIPETETIAYIDRDDDVDNATLLLNIPKPSEVILSEEVEEALDGDISKLFSDDMTIH